MLLNLAIGGTLGGYLDPDLEFPLRYYADYVRATNEVEVSPLGHWIRV